MVKIKDSHIPPCYKKTEVGVIPEEWDCRFVADVADVKGGKRLPKGYALQDEPTPHPYIRVSDMFPGGVRTENIKYVPLDAYPAIRNYCIYIGDIFISVAGTLGLVGKIPPELDGANLTENADRITNIRCDREYLMYWLMSDKIQQQIESIRTIGAQPKLALGRIEKFQIALPKNKSEQRAIARVLSDVDGLLEALDGLIEKKRALKTAAMQQLLTGKKRLPGFTGPWEKRKLGEIFSISVGVSKSSYITETGRYLIADMGAVSSNGKLISTRRTDLQDDPLFPGDLIMPKDDIGGGNIIGKTAVIREANKYVLGDHVYLLRLCINDGDPFFMSYMINSGQINKLLKNKASGSAQIGLNRKSVEEQEIPFPSIDEQRAIARVLSDMDAEIEALEAEREKVRQLKQGMMQVLLRGKVRLVGEKEG